MRHPVDEEDDMARLLIHQHVEDLEHRFRKEAGLARDLEDAEAEEGIEAFAIAEIDEGCLDVVGQGLQRRLGDIDAVALDHHLQQPGMARLLQALQRDRLMHQRIVNGLGKGVDDRAGPPLGMEHLLPEGHRSQPLQRRPLQLRPGQPVGLVQLVAGDELPAISRLVIR
jgi:hypothetical protein